MKVPIPVSTQIKRLSQTLATGIDEFSSLLKNVVVSIVDGVPKVSRRRGVAVVLDASDTPVSPTFGRGIHWSATVGATGFYIANYNTVYRNNYATSMGTFGAGSSLQENNKMYFATVEDGTYDTVVIDPTVNMGAALTIGGTFTSITAALPTPLNGGAVWLNGRLFVCGGNRIYNSDLNDVTAGYTDFVSAERSGDLVKIIVRHHDHIVAFGSNSIEFFYHDENPGATGSPLRRRLDIYFDIGLLDMAAIDVANDVIYFLSFGIKEGLTLYKIENFNLVKIDTSDSRFSRYIQSDYSSPNALNYLTAFSYEGRSLVCVTHCDDAAAHASVNDQIWSFVFEEDGRYYIWDTDGVSESAEFPLIGATNVDAQLSGGTVGSGTEWFDYGQLANGDVIRFKERWEAPDTFKDDLGGTEVEFTSQIDFEDFDGKTTGWKFCHAVEPLGDYEAGCEFDLSWSDEGGAYNTPRTLTKANRQRAVSCGRFSRRKFRLTSTDDSDSIDEHMELEGLDVDADMGTY